MRTIRIPARFLLASALAGAVVVGVACGGGDGPTGPGPGPTATKLALIVAPPVATPSGGVLATQPVVQLQDASGNPVPRAQVAITAAAAGASLIGGATVATGSDGRAVFTGLGLGGLAGARTLVFSAAGLQSASHAVTVVAGSATRIAASSELTQGGLIEAPVRFPPAVKITDAAGNAVAGVTVTFTVASGGGTAAGATPVSSAEGIAAVGSWTLGPSTGANSLTAAAAGLEGSPVTFSANGLLLMPTTMAAHAGMNQSALVEGAVPVAPAVLVTGFAGTPVPGVPVTFAVTVGNGTITGADAVTDANGIAAVGSWTLGTAGSNQLRATSAGLTGSPTFFTATAGHLGTIASGAAEQIGLVGMPVNDRPAVLVQTVSGVPVQGLPITFSVVSGGGTIQGATKVTNASGIAQVDGWTLGPVPGLNEMQAVGPPGYTGGPRRYVAHAFSQAASALAVHAGDGQTVPILATLPIAPAVRVTAADGSPVAGVPIEFEAPLGTVTGRFQTTNANGVATVGSWTLSAAAGGHSIAARSPIGNVAIIATALPGPATRLDRLREEAAPGRVGQVVQFPSDNLVGVRATDAYGNPIGGVSVTFAVGAGAGPGASVDGAPRITNAFGEATPVNWVLGTTSGTYALNATSAGLTPQTVTATAASGPAATIAMEQGDGQTAGVRRILPIDPAVRLRDQYGNNATGTVGFAVTSGGGSGGGVITAPATGIASSKWRLGNNPGANTLRATLTETGATVDFAATAVPVTSNFAIDVRYVSSVTAAQQQAFTAAAARWSDIILGDIPSINVSLLAGACFPTQPSVSESVDDVIIFVELLAIDGPGGVLGSAGPCLVRSASDLPAVGGIRLDVADVNALVATGELADVVLHEMAHVLGYGTMWPDRGVLFGAGTSNPTFTGPAAVTAYHALGRTGNVPVENTGGPGTADSHWRETTFQNELMTGYIGGTSNPLTRVTIGSLQDIGYQVDFGTADTLSFALNLRAASIPRVLRELPLPGPILVADDRGGIILQRRRR